MKYKAEIKIIPHPHIVEPQGRTILRQFDKLGIKEATDLRVGKLLFLELEATSEVLAHELVDQACKALLANPIIETYAFHLQPIAEEAPAPPIEAQPESEEEGAPAVDISQEEE